MKSHKTASMLAWIAAVLYVVTAAWHQSGLASISALAAQGPRGLQPLVAALWVSFGVSLVVLALIIALCARSASPDRRLVLAAAALGPLSGAVLQLAYHGFIAPTALLLLDAAVAFAAAVAVPRTLA